MQLGSEIFWPIVLSIFVNTFIFIRPIWNGWKSVQKGSLRGGMGRGLSKSRGRIMVVAVAAVAEEKRRGICRSLSSFNLECCFCDGSSSELELKGVLFA